MEKSQNFALALRELRNSKGITLDQISDYTKIKLKYLEKLESGDFSFKSDVYIKLFLKEYLKFIDIEKSESILQEFDSLFSTSTNIDLTFCLHKTMKNQTKKKTFLKIRNTIPKKLVL